MARPVTNHERDTMRRLRAEGRSLEDIAAEVGRTAPCVFAHVRDMPLRLPGGRPGLDVRGHERLLAAADDGVSYDDIAERFGLARSSIAPTVYRLRRARREAASVRVTPEERRFLEGFRRVAPPDRPAVRDLIADLTPAQEHAPC